MIRTALLSAMQLFLALSGSTVFSAQQPARAFPGSPYVYGKIETRPCAQRTPQGVAIDRVCAVPGAHSGLASHSSGKDCLFAVSYRDGTELQRTHLCYSSCTLTNLQPITNSCANTCALAFQGKVMFRSAGYIAGPEQDGLRQAYDQLLGLARADPAEPRTTTGNAARYKQLGGDSRREELKRHIIAVVLAWMIPYDVHCADQLQMTIPREKFRYPKEYSGTPDYAQGVVPLATNPTQGETQDVYESAFYMRGGAHLSIVPPDELAAELLHEMVHWKQQNLGYGEGKYGFLDPMHAAEHMLFEIMAFDVTEIHPFYQTVLSPGQRQDLVDVGRRGAIGTFMNAWQQINKNQRGELAKWTWKQTDGWMRSIMYFHPTNDGGVWGMLCTANWGRGPCNMIGK